jgi:Zn ribbon nucleic-acid-binding protein
MNYANSSPAPASLAGNAPVSQSGTFLDGWRQVPALSGFSYINLIASQDPQHQRTGTMAATLADNGFSFVQPVCQNCQTSTTPLWRRDEVGSVLCNACGLFLKLHGRPRPISLKTDVIKSRNRVKSTPHGQRKKVSCRTNASFWDFVSDKVTSSLRLRQMV